MLPWDELDGGKHLIHLRVSGHQTYCESIVTTIGPEQLSLIGEKGISILREYRWPYM